jgi:hypothetical protein
MPWQGDTDNMIDRFDVRAHLDIIPEVSSRSQEVRYNIIYIFYFFIIPHGEITQRRP